MNSTEEDIFEDFIPVSFLHLEYHSLSSRGIFKILKVDFARRT